MAGHLEWTEITTSDVRDLRETSEALRQSVQAVRDDVSHVRDDVSHMRDDLASLEVRVRQVLAIVQRDRTLASAAAGAAPLPIHLDGTDAAVTRAREVNRALRQKVPIPLEKSHT